LGATLVGLAEEVPVRQACLPRLPRRPPPPQAAAGI